jgi:uncharacterized protein (DUF302 family)
MKTHWIFLALAVATGLALHGPAQAASAEVVVRSAKGGFQDVKARVLHAIEDRGLVLNYTARIGAMLERTGKDIGAARRIYGDAEMLEFCSARLSRDTVEADPRNIVYCPYSIAIYTLPKDENRVYVAYRRIEASGAGKSADSLGAVNKLVADIVAEALK